jgi:hypothetical protein
MKHSTLPALLGYDEALLAQLGEDEQKQIERVAEAWLLSSVVLAVPIGYAVWLIEHSLLLAVLLGAGMLFVVLNMLRLSSAGGGVAPSKPLSEVHGYRPALGTTGVIGMLALLFAQPAQLPLWRTELDPIVAEQRERLAAEHERTPLSPRERVSERDAAGPLRAAPPDSYRESLARCDFIVLRLTTIWRQPTRALQLTSFYVLLVLLPTLWARFVALDALRAYALARWRSERAAITEAHAASERERTTLLATFTSFAPSPSSFADPPFETRVASPLLLPALNQPSPARRACLGRLKSVFRRGASS